MAKHIEVGRLGEVQAARYLESKGWSIIFRNYRLKMGELDIIARDPAGMVVFVEVKTLSGCYPSGFVPEDNLSRSKLSKLKRMCMMFVAKHSYMFGIEEGWRLDLITIILLSGKRAAARHYTNIY